MITVRIWQPGGGGIGHAACEVTGGSGGYVSWWPASNWAISAPGQAMPDYATDCSNEGRPADWSAVVSGLKEADGLKWWNAFSGNAASTYSASGQNCSWAAATFLKACDGDSRIAWSQSAHAYNMPEIMDLGWNKAYRFYLFTTAAGQGTPQLSDFADNHTMTWTPTDVLRYTNCVNGKSAEAGLTAAAQIAAPRINGRNASKKVRKI